MVSLMTYCIRNVPLLPKQRNYLYSVVKQIRDLCLKKNCEEIKFELVLLKFTQRVMLYKFALWRRTDCLVWDLAIARGAYWYKVAVARTLERISKQLLEEEQSF